MSKLAFTPFSLSSGLLAGLVGKRLFAAIWSAFDDEEPPAPEHRDVNLGKLVTALVIQGAVFTVVRGLVDHAVRHGFLRLSGSWPGDEEPQPKR
jgi:Protein of unknown function (DUF4235)